MRTIAISGGFDPLHIGHLRMMQEAAVYGRLIVILNSDEWLTRKKGKPVMCWDDRAELIRGYGYQVVKALDDDDTVCASLEILKPDMFGNGGDRVKENTPEGVLCRELGIKMLWGLGGPKIRSSSELMKK